MCYFTVSDKRNITASQTINYSSFSAMENVKNSENIDKRSHYYYYKKFSMGRVNRDSRLG
jgi:hypothetical protein